MGGLENGCMSFVILFCVLVCMPKFSIIKTFLKNRKNALAIKEDVDIRAMAEVEIKDTGSYLEEEMEKQNLNLIPDF